MIRTLHPIAGTSLASEAFTKLVAAITSGEFKPGEKLSESELARVIDFSRGDLEQLFYVREALEGMAARLAAQHMTIRELDSLEQMLAQHAVQPALAAGEAYVQKSVDEDFHFAIARAARCERLELLLLDEVYYQLRLHRLRSSTRPGRARAAFAEHQAILAALQSRNPARAEEVMREHVQNARFSALAASAHEDDAATHGPISKKRASRG